MTSFHQLSLFTIDYEVLPLNFSGKIQFESSHEGNVSNYTDPNDPRLADECPQYLMPFSCEIKEETSYITSATSQSNQEVCSCVKNILSKEHQKRFEVNDHRAVCSLRTRASRGEKIRLVKYAVFCDSIRYNNPKKLAELEMERALAIPMQNLYRKQEEYLADYWNNCYIEVEDDPESNLVP